MDVAVQCLVLVPETDGLISNLGNAALSNGVRLTGEARKAAPELYVVWEKLGRACQGCGHEARFAPQLQA
jgi:hypothetical protein